MFKVLSKHKFYILSSSFFTLKTFSLLIVLWNLLFYIAATLILLSKTVKNGHYQPPTATPTVVTGTGCTLCLNGNCKLYPFIHLSHTISNNLNNQVYPISQNTSCKTHNYIYALYCSHCTHILILYIGETKNTCHIRVLQHKHNILSYKDLAISNYLNQPDHKISMLQVSSIISLCQS